MNDKGLWIVWLSVVFSALAFFVALTSRAECDSKDPNMKTIKETIKEIRAIAAHPDVMYIHLHNEEREVIKKKMQWDPSLEIYLK